MTESPKQEQLLSAYLISGEDELKRNMVMKRLRNRVEDYGDLSFNFDTFSGETALGVDIVSSCNTLPFASEKRLVQVTNVDKLKKADSEELVSYLTSPNETTVLALIADKLAKNTRLYKAVATQGKKAIIDCAPQKRYELAKTVRSLAVTHGITITEGAAQALIEQVGENTIFLDSELRKLALAHQGNDAVSEHEVRSLIARTAEVKPWDFVDAFAARNIDKAFINYQRMDSVSPHALLAMCVTRLRELICARSLYDRGCPHQLPTLLKMPDWRVKNHIMWARGFSALELRQAIISARDVEQAMKSGTDPQAAFTEWILSVICFR